jgi:hypothetical protein
MLPAFTLGGAASQPTWLVLILNAATSVLVMVLEEIASAGETYAARLHQS